jgi:SAM-dependent methyltransferase
MPGAAARQIITGAEYIRQITALESDRRARATFLDLALQIVPPGAALFDFGSGPGIDARFYAQHGLRVTAYDVDTKMCEFFAEHCRDLMNAGSVKLKTGPYSEFLAQKRAGDHHGVDLVTSNFAPLNLVPDLGALFATFHALTGPRGKVLASVLNPYFAGDLRYSWWWRNAPRLWRVGHFSVPGAQAPIVRRRLANFAANCGPYFKLERVFKGLPAAPAIRANGIDVSNGPGHAWTRLTTCRFMFLLFQKRELGVGGDSH